MINITESFIFGVLGLFFGGMSMLLGKFFKFKCSKINCFGVSCIRDIDLENQAQEFEVEHNIRAFDTIPNSSSRRYSI
jgi:hypothetical protein